MRQHSDELTENSANSRILSLNNGTVRGRPARICPPPDCIDNPLDQATMGGADFQAPGSFKATFEYPSLRACAFGLTPNPVSLRW